MEHLRNPFDIPGEETATEGEDVPFLGENLAAIRHNPPPHIQERLTHKARLSRRSSASTSRRNSLSSLHSHASSVSRTRGARNALHSHYIAQHLRRASILEDRRARLADRNAHAEQVRHRAALAKAAPRAAASVEKTIAAQLAKEKYLAKVAATCAEEVARAKRIAEEVKERKQAEENKARLDLEEKHAEAERRRAEFQRNLQARRTGRADSTEKKLPVVEEDDANTIDRDAAIRRIQRAWRSSQNRGHVTAFVNLELNAEQSSKRTFEEMTELLNSSAVLAATTTLLTHVGLEDAGDSNAGLNTRTFLSSFMLVGHANVVLNNKNGSQEQDLVSKAHELVSTFEDSLARLAHWNDYKPSPMQFEALSQIYSAYTSAFAAWRLQDSSVLIEGMVASFVELDAIWQTVKDDSYGEVASDYREGIRDNQVKLLSRIQKLAGRERADMLIKKAIRESRRARPKKRPVAEVRPRMVEGTVDIQAAADTVDTQAIDLTVEDVQDYGELSRLFTSMPTNRILTHELALDKDFKLTEDKERAELHNQFYRAVCDNMKRGFQEGNGTQWTVSAAHNIRQRLLRTLKPGNSLYALIDETLDIEFIQKQCQNGVFSYEGFFKFMANLMPKLCAPFRDQEVKKLCQALLAEPEDGDDLTSMTEKLFLLLRMVDKLSLDYTNFMIMNAAPTLIAESAGYEHRSFAKDMVSGQISLERTFHYWRRSAASLLTEAERRNPEGVNDWDRPTRHKIYAKGLTDLAVSTDVLENEIMPETLALDFVRLKNIRAATLRVAVIGAVFLTAKNLLKRDVRSQWKTEAGRVWTLLLNEGYEKDSDADEEALSPASKVLGILESAHNMPQGTKMQVQSAITRFFAQAAARRLTDPVLKVLYSRLKTHIFNRLAAWTSAEKVRAAASAADALVSSGLGEFVSVVGKDIVELLEKIRQVDWAAHGLWYEQIDVRTEFDDLRRYAS